MTGPPPKRSEQRRRRNKPTTEITKADGAAVVEVPTADPKWHPIALSWYESLNGSGQSQFYEPSDWATAYLLAESMSRELQPVPVLATTKDGVDIQYVTMPPKAASVASWLKGMTSLLITEGDRRRAALELQRPEDPEDVPDVSEFSEYRKRLRGESG